jgi:glycosyltransferase involved in cell wall biosynthesis
VVVPTFRRVERLELLLPALVDQAATIGARVIVIDNDPDAGARATVAGWADVGVRYAHEPRPGISAARNRGIDESALADALVYIDDDEMPAPGWLEALVAAWLRHGCDAVTGPVQAVYPSPVDPWVLAAGVLDQPARTSGTRMNSVASNNLLLDIGRIAALGMRFDERFGLTEARTRCSATPSCGAAATCGGAPRPWWWTGCPPSARRGAGCCVARIGRRHRGAA